MGKKNVIFLLFFFFFSYGYSNVTYTINYTEDHSQYMVTGHAPITIYQPHLKITRTSNNEAIDINISSVKLYSMSSIQWVKFFIKPNLQKFKSNKLLLSMKKLYLNGKEITISRVGYDIAIVSAYSKYPQKNLTADFNLTIAANIPDFSEWILGHLVQVGNEIPIPMGTVSLVTLHPLTIDVPDIDFGDVIVTSGNKTKSGQITVTGSTNTKVSFDIPTHDFRLYKTGDKIHSMNASANIDGATIKQEFTIQNNGVLTKQLNVTISNFANLPPGRYEGDLTININSN